jgi:hypothetical protein
MEKKQKGGVHWPRIVDLGGVPHCEVVVCVGTVVPQRFGQAERVVDGDVVAVPFLDRAKVRLLPVIHPLNLLVGTFYPICTNWVFFMHEWILTC